MQGVTINELKEMLNNNKDEYFFTVEIESDEVQHDE